MLCSEWSLVKHHLANSQVIPLRCNCWTCEECAPIRKARLYHEAMAGRPKIFITITSRRRLNWTAAYAAQRLVKAWRIARQAFMRKHDLDSFPFLAVFEKTKEGWPHLHIVARVDWMSQKWLAKKMKKLHDSPICWVEKLNSRRKTARYITKYISKDPERFHGTKRYWRSMDYLSKVYKQPPCFQKWAPSWEIYKEHWKTVAQDWERWGHEVHYMRNEAYVGQRGPP